MILDYPTIDDAVQASRRGRYGVPMGDTRNRVLVSVLGDRWMMYLDSRDVSLTPYLIHHGIFEPYVLAAICGVVKPGMTCVDVGANFGYHTLLLCELVGRTGRVHAFEPQPSVFSTLRLNMEINHYATRARPYPNAIGEAEGTGELTIHKRRFGWATLSERAKASFGSANVSVAAVHVSRLDDLLATAPEPDFYLLSAAGYEPQIWAGMTGLLNARRKLTLLLDFTYRWYQNPLAFAGAILEQGFLAHRLHESGPPEPLAQPEDFTTQRSWVLLTR